MDCPQAFFVWKSGVMASCGRCNACVANARREWAHRLYVETKASWSSRFITLTYDEKSLVFDIQSKRPTLEKSHVQKFIKKIRKREFEKFKNQDVRYYSVGEYGSITDRPHYHMLLYNVNNETLGKIADVWGAGMVDVGSVTESSIMYVAGYVINRRDYKDKGETRVLPFAQMSKGIGKQYLTPQMKKFHKRGLRNHVVWEGGRKDRLSRYFKTRIFNSHELERVKFENEKRRYEDFERKWASAARFHSDPSYYMVEQSIEAYNSIKCEKSGHSL